LLPEEAYPGELIVTMPPSGEARMQEGSAQQADNE